MNRFRTEIPKSYITIGDLVRSSIGSVIATKKTELRTRDQVLAELLPIVSEQFGVDIEKLHSTTRFFEDIAG